MKRSTGNRLTLSLAAAGFAAVLLLLGVTLLGGDGPMARPAAAAVTAGVGRPAMMQGDCALE